MKTKKHPDRKLTLRKFADLFYFPQKILKDSTIKTIRHSLNRWERLTDDPTIEDIGKVEIHHYSLACTDIAKASINQHRQVVKVLLGWAVELDILKTVPKIKKLRLDQLEPIAPTLEEVSLLYDNVNVAAWPVIPNCSTAQWWRAWIVVSYFTAARLGDMKNSLLWSNVEDEWLTYTALKTGIRHHIPLHPVLVAHLKKLKRHSVRDDRIFYVSPKMTVDHLIRREMNRISKAAGIPKVTPKFLRNTSITEWGISHRDAGDLVHGAGIQGMRRHYGVRRRVMSAALESFAIPKAFKSAGRNAEEAAIKRARKRRMKVHAPEFQVPVKPNPNEWKFDEISFTFRGTRFLLTGKRLVLLKALATDPESVAIEPLVKAVFGNQTDINDDAIHRTHIELANLRVKLRRAFGLEHSWNPIVCLERGGGGLYTIHLPVVVNEKRRAAK